VLTRDEAAALWELPRDREADLVVTGDRNTVIGASEAEHDVSALTGHRLRSHGGAYEQSVPFLLSHKLTPDYLRLSQSQRLRNFAIFEFALSGVAP
jgi:phosphonoacetate hydrolase